MPRTRTTEKEIDFLEELRARGYDFVCLGCNLVYRKKPQETYEDGHGGRKIDMCSCGSDLFLTVDKVIEGLRRNSNLIKFS